MPIPSLTFLDEDPLEPEEANDNIINLDERLKLLEANGVTAEGLASITVTPDDGFYTLTFNGSLGSTLGEADLPNFSEAGAFEEDLLIPAMGIVTNAGSSYWAPEEFTASADILTDVTAGNLVLLASKGDPGDAVNYRGLYTGTPSPAYAQGDGVTYTDNLLYAALVDAPSALPGADDSQWRAIFQPYEIDTSGFQVIDSGSTTLDEALADIDAALVVLNTGFDDLTGEDVAVTSLGSAADLTAVDDVQAALVALVARTDAAGRDRNHFINGGFQVAQRGTSTGITAADAPNKFLGPDRWQWLQIGGSVTDLDVTVSRQAFGPNEDPLGSGSRHYLRVLFTDPASTNHYVQQSIIDAARFLGNQVTLSYWIRGTARTGAVRAEVVITPRTGGTYNGLGAEVAFTESYFDVTGTWTKRTLTGTVGNRALAAGDWSNSVLQVRLRVLQDIPQAGDIIEFGDLKLNDGPVATAFRPLPYPEDLRECLPYCFVSAADCDIPLVKGRESDRLRLGQLPVPGVMRAAPTVTLLDADAGITVTDVTRSSVVVQATAGADATVPRVRQYRLEAEL